MGHLALYRKWRPEVFEDLVGQDHISRTLLNAINKNRIAHAYLFCGPRGTGKTTSARILAKALNCESRVNGSPCNKCGSCKDSVSGASLDVIEIDAASNRGISEIKNLIEQVKFASVSGKYKVYIIDEFHMLTTEAFNAILKTLEEPPDKVVFVLATTEAHKILPTIISRCQRFDFQRIPVSLLVKRLRYISDQENIEISDDSLLSISRKANGGLRDAISLLDQISSFSTGEGEIPTELVYKVLGMVSNDFLTKLTTSIANKEPVVIIQTLSELLKAGNDPVVIITETINYFRHLLIVKTSLEMAEELEVPTISIEDLKKVSDLYNVDEILECIEFLNEATEKIKKTNQSQLWLEINFVQLCKKTKSLDYEKIMQKASELEDKLKQLQNINIEKINKLQDINISAIRTTTYIPDTESPNIKNNNGNGNGSKPDSIENLQENQTVNNKISLEDNINIDLDSLWERILIETKKKSIPASSLLSNGKLSDVDIKSQIVTVNFENEGFIEFMKKSKYLKVEQALNSIFGKPYKLRMEKGSYSPQKKNISLTGNNNKIQFNSEQNKDNDLNNNSSVMTLTKPENDISQNIANSTDLRSNINISISNEYNIELETDVQTHDYQITDNIKDYKIEIKNESSDLENKEIFEISETNTENKTLYFKDVADVFKGKIINKIKH